MTASRLRREGKGRKMANRRMFSLDVVNTDKFMDMPISAQCLYFHLGMRADNRGFLPAAGKALEKVPFGKDDLRLLIAKGYVTLHEDGRYQVEQNERTVRMNERKRRLWDCVSGSDEK